ncbi:uncharacterized protein EI90DRAFT_3089979 [Cantharellus anzutake]|uniref:uncharacterized protein n=1 Tax=Cantharellus anzutake TaxID=1750568 RepID=UPI0019060307|nr:uncharacterized protein EI90DRAFT_3089979 [Cantharellus anzutake]KAF8314568.1 hypothetical protein EI90DRAFT_3089979 [Cantharellus anzutake]
MLKPIIPLVGLLSKACLYVNKVQVSGLDVLQRALKESNGRGKGVLTISNHISVVDEPFVWGCLPISQYFRPRDMRWTLGASDIMFTNPIFSSFFRAGQVIETFRGRGIYQPAVNDAVRKLDDGAWIHLFPEGYVNQAGGLLRFRWGVGRIIMNTRAFPTIIPMWLSGFDKLMPESRSFPKFIPRLSPKHEVSITFGNPIDFKASYSPLGPLTQKAAQLMELGERLETHRRRRRSDTIMYSQSPKPLFTQRPLYPLSDHLFPSRRHQLLEKRIQSETGLAESLDYGISSEAEVVQLRKDVTAHLQECVHALGKLVGK